MQKEIKVKVIFTDGYEKRFTKAFLEVFRKRENKNVEETELGLNKKAG